MALTSCKTIRPGKNNALNLIETFFIYNFINIIDACNLFIC